jgi:AraC-like DNA-binding protein
MIINILLYIKDIVVYFAIIQSFFLAFHFYSNKNLNSQPNKILAILILLFGLSVLTSQLFVDRSINLFFFSKSIFNIRTHINLLLMVILYFHIKSILSKDFKLLKKSNIKFIVPVVISFFCFRSILNATPWPIVQPGSFFFINLSIYTLTYYLFYLVLIYIFLAKKFQTYINFSSAVINPNKQWLSFIIGTFIFIWIVEFAQLIIMLSNNFLLFFPYLVIIYTFIPFIFINAILFFLLKNPKLFLYKKGSNGTNVKMNPNHLIDRVNNLLNTDKIFTDPEISLSKVAERLGVNPKYLSIEINENLNQSFIDLINSYRVNESKKLLISFPNKTIQEIMFEVGYNSKSVFNSHFKKDTGMTPKEFRLKNNI